jgi:hypothetical protein
MVDPPRYLRFEGHLWENLTFERVVGWETVRVARLPDKGGPTFMVELRDDAEVVITQVAPLVDFGREPICPSGDELQSTTVVAYVPFHPRGREIVFRRGEFIIHREPVAAQPPTISIEEVTVASDGQVAIRWSAEHPDERSLTYNIVYLANNQRAFPIVRGLNNNAYTADLRPFPGSPEGCLAVLATDGTRSAFAVSEPFVVEEKPPQVWIQTPGTDDLLPADQPVSLCGHALDVAGASLPAEGLVWRVDGEVAARDSHLAIAQALEPGEHQINLEYVVGDTVVAHQTLDIRIAERSPEQQRFIEMLNSIDFSSAQ